MPSLTSLEVCAGAGGQAIGLEQAGFEHVAVVDNDAHACGTLRYNRPHWKVIEQDLRTLDGSQFRAASGAPQLSLLAGGVPCPPFSAAGKQHGPEDERDLFPEMIRLARECAPQAVMIENVRGLLDARFDGYRRHVETAFAELGLESQGFRRLDAADFGVPQLRPRTIFVALRPDAAERFEWPTPSSEHISVGDALRAEMASAGWLGAEQWADAANRVAPTIVGGSKKHGGPDLGPTRARREWMALGVEGRTIAEAPPEPDHVGPVRLTVRMGAILQGFPDDWVITGRKTHAWRQVGNAFPPPVARAVGLKIAAALG